MTSEIVTNKELAEMSIEEEQKDNFPSTEQSVCEELLSPSSPDNLKNSNCSII
jgi:hypothetical protein